MFLLARMIAYLINFNSIRITIVNHPRTIICMERYIRTILLNINIYFKQ